MKKYLWIVALIAALAMVMAGCDNGGGGTTQQEEYDEETVKESRMKVASKAPGN